MMGLGEIVEEMKGQPNKERIDCLLGAMRTVDEIQRLHIQMYRTIVDAGYRVA